MASVLCNKSSVALCLPETFNPTANTLGFLICLPSVRGNLGVQKTFPVLAKSKENSKGKFSGGW